jgi:hypothetical protein
MEFVNSILLSMIITQFGFLYYGWRMALFEGLHNRVFSGHGHYVHNSLPEKVFFLAILAVFLVYH